ncbi:MAG: hypothetical protein JSV31_13665 [Desulfobacterales bacterium]|nr:MAG: hypothetical protein JSV31_13665 [Desulfobacterales bacterium]
MFKRILMALKFAPASEFALIKGVELANSGKIVSQQSRLYRYHHSRKSAVSHHVDSIK